MKRLLYTFLILTFLCVFVDAQAVRRAAPMATVAGGGIAELSSQRATTRAAGGADPVDLPYPGNVTTGNLLVVAGITFGTLADVTDDVGTTYTVDTFTWGSGAVTFFAYGIANGSGANTVTVDFDPGNYTSFAITEFSGVHATPLDVSGGGTANTGTAAADSITTVAANALIVGVVANQSANSTLTPHGDYTQFGEEEDWNNWATYNAVFRIVTTATSYSVSWTLGTSSTWGAQTISFKPA